LGNVDKFDEVVLGLRFHARPKHAAAGLGSLPADVMEGRAGAFVFEHVGGGERVGIGDGAVFLLGNLRGGNAEAEKAGIDGAEDLFDGRVIQKILVDKGAQLGTGVHQRAPGDGAHFVDDGSGKAGVEDGCTRGACCAEEEDFHGEFDAPGVRNDIILFKIVTFSGDESKPEILPWHRRICFEAAPCRNLQERRIRTFPGLEARVG
jgi:hypothetical protein